MADLIWRWARACVVRGESSQKDSGSAPILRPCRGHLAAVEAPVRRQLRGAGLRLSR